MADNHDSLLDLINASGFLFQVRVEREIEKLNLSSSGWRWDVIAREHRWVDPFDGKEGFIDLIIGSDVDRVVIECKRTTDASWLFLIPKDQAQTSQARLLWTYEGPIPRETYRRKLFEWHNFQAKPRTYESMFCIIRGKGEKEAPMLERLASQLLRSVEGLAKEEVESESTSQGNRHLYIPTIITNAKLIVCQHKIDDVDISTGRLEKADFFEVPFVRFRKNLSSSTPEHTHPDLEKANLYNERTVFVVSSNSIGEFLTNFDLPYQNNIPWPWEWLSK
jgi:hypothetical protein